MNMKVTNDIWAEHNKAREKYPIEHDDQFGWEHLSQEAEIRSIQARLGIVDTREALVQAAGLLISAIEWVDRHSIPPAPDGQEKPL